jgi:hypothetical protein
MQIMLEGEKEREKEKSLVKQIKLQRGHCECSYVKLY